MITVITPVYNGKRFIEACIQNVIDQNYPDVEHVIVDGGSNDGTVEVITRYSERYPHIRWVSEKDRGQSDAMNKGVAMATNEVIGFLNVDDYYEPAVLNRVSNIFQDLESPSFVAANCNFLNSHDEVIAVSRPKKLNFLWMLSRIYPYPCNPSAYFYHKSVHQVIGEYDINDHYAMDLDFILRVVQHSKSVYIDEVWGNFRVIEGTKTFISSSEDNMDSRSLRIIKKYRGTLPAHEKVLIFLGEQIIYRFKYFYENPSEIRTSFKRKIRLIPHR
jgi:glycosyltransferase involved in cell wall biosynthesis